MDKNEKTYSVVEGSEQNLKAHMIKAFSCTVQQPGQANILDRLLSFGNF